MRTLYSFVPPSEIKTPTLTYVSHGVTQKIKIVGREKVTLVLTCKVPITIVDMLMKGDHNGNFDINSYAAIILWPKGMNHNFRKS